MWDKEDFLVIPEDNVEITLAPASSFSSITITDTVLFPEMQEAASEAASQAAAEEEASSEISVVAAAERPVSEGFALGEVESSGTTYCLSTWIMLAAYSAVVLLA